MFIEDLESLLLWACALVFALIVVFLMFLGRRRVQRHRYFMAKDAARARYIPVIKDAARNGVTVGSALEMLATGTAEPERVAIAEELGKHAAAGNVQAVELLYGLNYVDQWARAAFGKTVAEILIRRSAGGEAGDSQELRTMHWLDPVRKTRVIAIPRAAAIENLAKLPLQRCRPFLAEALQDPAAMVRKIAVSHLAAKRDAGAVTLLCEELHQAVISLHDVSLRDIRGALAKYEVTDLDYFLPWLTHPQQRVRLFVVDTIAEICRKHMKKSGMPARNDFSPALYRAMLQQVSCDSFADVRARSAHIIRFFNDGESLVTIRSLLRDENEFVRMHTLRAIRHRSFEELADDVLERLSDTKWRVREAAVQTLAAIGSVGLDKLLKFFVDCTDQYACEAIADEIQRGGYVRDLLAAIANQHDDAGLALAACDKLTMLHKTSVLTAALATVTNTRVQVALIDCLSLSPTDEFIQVLDAIANSSQTTASQRALALLRAYSGEAIPSNPAGSA